jgi:oligopeptide/dipeptide ABC transporter ATP-binding protein
MVPAPDAMPAGCRFAPRCTVAVEQCRHEMPPLRKIGAGHLVACWRAPIEGTQP